MATKPSIERLDALYQDNDYTGVCTKSLVALVQARESQWRTVENLSYMSGVPQTNLTRILTGRVQWTSLNNADKICFALGENVSQQLVVIPAASQMAAQKMALDELRTQGIPESMELIAARGQQLSLLRDRILGEQTDEQKRFAAKERSRGWQKKRKASDAQMPPDSDGQMGK